MKKHQEGKHKGNYKIQYQLHGTSQHTGKIRTQRLADIFCFPGDHFSLLARWNIELLFNKKLEGYQHLIGFLFKQREILDETGKLGHEYGDHSQENKQEDQNAYKAGSAPGKSPGIQPAA